MEFINYSHIYKNIQMIFPFDHDCSCRWMADFLEKSILLDGLCGTFPSEKAKVKDECI